MVVWEALDDVSLQLLVFFVAFGMPAEILNTDTFLAPTSYGSDLRDGLFKVVVYVLFAEHIMWLWIGDRFCEVVGHRAGLKTLESGILYLIQLVVVENGDEGVVVCDGCEVW